ncbi:MAG: SCO family protein [Lutibacter sp.]|nr:SCO family protein [Lutibacter sp.]
MKNYRYIGVAFVVLVFGIYAVPKIVAHFERPVLAKIGNVPPFSFTNQQGLVIDNTFYEDKVYVVEFFFTNCPTICPKMNENMLRIQDAFYGHPAVGIASISIDPQRDTPAVLARYAEQLGAVSANWHFLTGDLREVYELANKGFTLYAGENPQAAGGFEHSGMFALVDKQGMIRSRSDAFGNPLAFYDGLSAKGIQMIKEDINILLKE